MLFGRRSAEQPRGPSATTEPAAHMNQPTVVLFKGADVDAVDSKESGVELLSPVLLQQFGSVVGSAEVVVVRAADAEHRHLERAISVVALFPSTEELEKLNSLVLEHRRKRGDATPSLTIAVSMAELTRFGEWLYRSAVADKLYGIRLIVATSCSDVPLRLKDKLGPCSDCNVIAMPSAPEADRTASLKYLYLFSPESVAVSRLMKEFAENRVERIYLLGGPGTGKSSVAYYYYLVRAAANARGRSESSGAAAKGNSEGISSGALLQVATGETAGNFVQVNLTAESTGDKASMKSLLCGHVSGAFPGSGSREGALAFARNGVCFLDESHGVTGVVMQVLMEVLDSGQFLPFGATAKRALECAVIFASNRSWETLRSIMHLDEHARLGAAIISISDLAVREEDMIAVTATTLARFKEKCRTWTAPEGLTEKAWLLLKNCQWRGNIRTLIRVIETASVNFACQRNGATLLDIDDIEHGMALWEPADLVHMDDKLYVSVR